jgi:hypothetical protein
MHNFRDIRFLVITHYKGKSYESTSNLDGGWVDI